jgi:hypothetical protein
MTILVIILSIIGLIFIGSVVYVCRGEDECVNNISTNETYSVYKYGSESCDDIMDK